MKSETLEQIADRILEGFLPVEFIVEEQGKNIDKIYVAKIVSSDNSVAAEVSENTIAGFMSKALAMCEGYKCSVDPVKTYVVTYTEDYILEEQHVYGNKEDAEKKEIELNKKLFNESFKKHHKDFSKDETFMDYQDSTCWWDDDCRSKVYLRELEIETHFSK